MKLSSFWNHRVVLGGAKSVTSLATFPFGGLQCFLCCSFTVLSIENSMFTYWIITCILAEEFLSKLFNGVYSLHMWYPEEMSYAEQNSVYCARSIKSVIIVRGVLEWATTFITHLFSNCYNENTPCCGSYTASVFWLRCRCSIAPALRVYYNG